MGDMSSAEAVQCTVDIKGWFARTSCAKNMRGGANSVDIQGLEKTIDSALPSSLKAVLSEINGGIYFMDKRQLNTAQIAEATGRMERTPGWKAGLIPFCGDEDTLLVIDTRYGEVMEWDVNDGKGDTVASSLEQFLENYRNDLLSGHFEYLEDIGVIEKMGGKAASKK
jgi:cell wall assembly regulator SMI1